MNCRRVQNRIVFSRPPGAEAIVVISSPPLKLAGYFLWSPRTDLVGFLVVVAQLLDSVVALAEVTMGLLVKSEEGFVVLVPNDNSSVFQTPGNPPRSRRNA
jgi:hypothetical protein